MPQPRPQPQEASQRGPQERPQEGPQGGPRGGPQGEPVFKTTVSHRREAMFQKRKTRMHPGGTRHARATAPGGPQGGLQGGPVYKTDRFAWTRSYVSEVGQWESSWEWAVQECKRSIHAHLCTCLHRKANICNVGPCPRLESLSLLN